MKSTIPLLIMASLSSFASAAEKLPPGHPPVSGDQAAPHGAPASSVSGKVLDVIDVAQYTYLEVTVNGKNRWIAAPSATVKKGDNVHFDEGLEMKDFRSNTLDRSFPSITFVSRVTVGNP